jgi:uroporphyrinogen decarboxylase
MKPRDRVRMTLSHSAPDRPPLDGVFRAQVWRNLRDHLGLRDDDQILERLGFDFRQAVIEPSAAFAATAAPAPVDAGVGVGSRNLTRILPDGEFEDDRGIRRIAGSTGAYFRFSHHPLGGAETPDTFTFPSPDLPERYAHIREQVRRFTDRCMVQVETGNIFRDAWELRGFEPFLVDTRINHPFARRLLDRITEHKIADVGRMIEAGVDIIQMAGDIATEQGMLISPAWWRVEIKPRLARVIAATRRPGVYYYFHSDGAMQAVIPDLVEIGFDIVNPLQPECMDIVAIKRQYGSRITLHSTLSSQRTLPFGSVDDVRAEVRARIRDLNDDGGLILAPSNVVQSDVPLENLLAVYDETLRSTGARS